MDFVAWFGRDMRIASFFEACAGGNVLEVWGKELRTCWWRRTRHLWPCQRSNGATVQPRFLSSLMEGCPWKDKYCGERPAINCLLVGVSESVLHLQVFWLCSPCPKICFYWWNRPNLQNISKSPFVSTILPEVFWFKTKLFPTLTLDGVNFE